MAQAGSERQGRAACRPASAHRRRLRRLPLGAGSGDARVSRLHHRPLRRPVGTHRRSPAGGDSVPARGHQPRRSIRRDQAGVAVGTNQPLRSNPYGCIGQTDRPHASHHVPGNVNVVARTRCAVAVPEIIVQTTLQRRNCFTVFCWWETVGNPGVDRKMNAHLAQANSAYVSEEVSYLRPLLLLSSVDVLIAAINLTQVQNASESSEASETIGLVQP